MAMQYQFSYINAKNTMDEACEQQKYLRKKATKRTIMLRIRKRKLNFLEEKKEGLENLTFTGHMENKKSRGKHQIT